MTSIETCIETCKVRWSLFELLVCLQFIQMKSHQYPWMTICCPKLPRHTTSINLWQWTIWVKQIWWKALRSNDSITWVLLPAPCKQKNIETKHLPPPNQIYQTLFQIASSKSLSSTSAIAKKPHWEQISKPNVTNMQTLRATAELDLNSQCDW
jgi:hypothetical protein